MSVVTDISGLVALEEQAPAPVVETEKPLGLPASDLSAKEEKTAETEVEETKADVDKDGKGKTEKVVSTTEAVKLPKAADVHKTLGEFFKEATPEGKEKLQALNGQLRDLYAGLKEAQSTSKDVAEVIKASEELETLVSNTDQLLYDSADPAKASELVQNIWNDVQENATPEAFTGFAVSTLDKLKAEAPDAYYKHVVLPSYQHALETTGVVSCVKYLIGAYNQGDKTALREGIAALAAHLEEVQGKSGELTKAAETAKATREQTAYTDTVRSECETLLNKGLGKALSPILNGTELGTYERDVQLTVAREMRQEFSKRLQADKPYWDALNAAYAKHDSVRIKQLYSTKVNSLADDVTKTVIARIYPNGLEKRAGKVTVKASAAKQMIIKTPLGDAVYVSAKPKDLDREARGAGAAEIAGYGYRKGSKQLITWKKNH